MAENDEGGKEGENENNNESGKGEGQEGQQGGEGEKGGTGEGSGEGAQGWLNTSGLSEETLKDPSLKNFLADKDGTKFVESHLALRKMVGNSVRIPGEDATPEEIEAFKDKFRPEKAEGQDLYQYTPPEDMPHPEMFNKELLLEVQKEFYDAGFSQEQYSKAMDIYDNTIKGFDAQAEESFAQQEISAKEDLQKDPRWRGAGYARNEALAKEGVAYLFGDDPKGEARAFLDGTNIMGSNPHFMRAMNKLGRDIAEGGGIENNSITKGLTGLQSEDAATEINAVRTDKTHRYHDAYRDNTHKDHAAAKSYMSELYSIKSPGNVQAPEFLGKNK